MTHAPNPYEPPRAELDDVRATTGMTQDAKVWSARGRIGRLRFVAYNVVAGLIFGGVSELLRAVLGPELANAITGLLFIALLVLTAFTAIQRAHDMGWSGWTALLVIVPLVFFVWMFKRGTPGENRHGAPPTPNPLLIKVFGLWVPLLLLLFFRSCDLGPQGVNVGY